MRRHDQRVARGNIFEVGSIVLEILADDGRRSVCTNVILSSLECFSTLMDRLTFDGLRQGSNRHHGRRS